ncbi:tonB-system energizer ExbB [Allorhizobium sp. BGMRC 0089]|uniref:tonB-system energizer ExbB n=1 Tax=Allorhizobium sonneratiae TaxID=2934936 RepID=UPI002033F73F|nr:tonB-system energizer ExbB [Allorhizobium sonneratiae]MCM2294578.1 tonB-system energizer ExbB [Allorhizobium sonneratiae]
MAFSRSLFFLLLIGFVWPVAAVPALAQAPAPAEETQTTVSPQTVAPSVAGQTSAEAVPLQSAPAEDVRADIPHDLSPVGMFMAADIVVKAVMLLLGAASLATWTILIGKTLQLFSAKARLRRALSRMMAARSLPQALENQGAGRGVLTRMLNAAAEEMKLSEAAFDHGGTQGVKERVSSVLARIEAHAARSMAAGTGILATIGSIGPFVGLFGTVWGIMNAFIGISKANTTNLAVVAPGIAEALLATAIGLVAAIPAVVVYNIFARSISGYRQQLLDVSAAIERLVSRELDFRHVPADIKAARLKLVTE